MWKAAVSVLLLSGCAGSAFQERTRLLAEVSPGMSPRWVQSSVDGRIAAFIEVAPERAHRVVVTGRSTGSYHFL